MSNITRRSLLAGLAAAPVAIPTRKPAPDPQQEQQDRIDELRAAGDEVYLDEKGEVVRIVIHFDPPAEMRIYPAGKD